MRTVYSTAVGTAVIYSASTVVSLQPQQHSTAIMACSWAEVRLGCRGGVHGFAHGNLMLMAASQSPHLASSPWAWDKMLLRWVRCASQNCQQHGCDSVCSIVFSTPSIPYVSVRNLYHRF